MSAATKSKESVNRRNVVIKVGSSVTTVNNKTSRVTTRAQTFGRWGNLTHPDLLLLPTFERGFYTNAADEKLSESRRVNPKLKTVVFKRPSLYMNSIGCDRCSGPHSFKTKTCSATLNIKSPFLSKPAGLYDIKTGVRLKPQPVALSEDINKRGSLRRVLLQF